MEISGEKSNKYDTQIKDIDTQIDKLIKQKKDITENYKKLNRYVVLLEDYDIGDCDYYYDTELARFPSLEKAEEYIYSKGFKYVNGQYIDNLSWKIRIRINIV